MQNEGETEVQTQPEDSGNSGHEGGNDPPEMSQTCQK